MNKIANKITKVSKSLPQNNSETNKEEILREKKVLLMIWDQKKKIIDNLRFI